MKIEIWSDYTCPYCYIGKKRLELALEQLGIRNEVSTELKSYELDAKKIETNNLSIVDYLKQKYELSLTEVDDMLADIKLQASEAGLDFNFTNLKQQNTFDAHRLVKYAYEKQKGNEMVERLLRAYFKESAELSNREVLTHLAKEIELDEEEVTSLLCLNNYAKKVRDDIDEANEIGVEGVPFFIFDDQYALSGMQSIEIFIDVIQETRKNYKKKPELQSVGKEGSYCTDEGCVES